MVPSRPGREPAPLSGPQPPSRQRRATSDHSADARSAGSRARVAGSPAHSRDGSCRLARARPTGGARTLGPVDLPRLAASDPALADPLDQALDLLTGRPLVALTGAGLSTDSGIPDYRGPSSPRRTPMTYTEF